MAHLLAFSLCMFFVLISGAEKAAADEECQIEGRSVSTFDGVTTKITDSTSCILRVTRECTDGSNKMIVSARDIGSRNIQLQVLLPGIKITAQRQPQSIIDISIGLAPKIDVDVRVNGAPEILPYLFYSNGQINSIERTSRDEIKIRNPVQDVNFNPKETMIFIKRHKSSNSQLCGLCSALEATGCPK